MDTKHTPGPWEVAELDGMEAYRIRHAGRYGEAIVAVVPPAEGWSLAHQDANAALIAAAPELLEALKGVLNAYADGWGMERAMDITRAAIAKAEWRE